MNVTFSFFSCTLTRGRLVIAILVALFVGGAGLEVRADISKADYVFAWGAQSLSSSESFPGNTYNQSGLSTKLTADNLASVTHTNGFINSMVYLAHGTKSLPIDVTLEYTWNDALTNKLKTIAIWNYSQFGEPNRSATSVIISVDTGDGYTTITNLILTQNNGTIPVVSDLLDIEALSLTNVAGIKLALVQDKLDTHGEYTTGLSEVAFLFEGVISPSVSNGDPRFPSDLLIPQPMKRAIWPWVQIQKLEQERDQLLKKISVLPQHAPIYSSDRLGYHSLFEEQNADGSFSTHWIDFKLKLLNRLDSIALIPALNPKKTGTYAFPKRFKIEVRSNPVDTFETVVNWMEEDFPDPGPYPVFFSKINRAVKEVRITVLPTIQESGMAYYALDEIYFFRQKENGQIADNMAIWGNGDVTMEASDSFSMPPLWDISYLYDDFTGLGFPLGEEATGPEDLMVTCNNEMSSSNQVQFLLDLGRVVNVGRVDFWPAAAPYLLAIPSFGFPEKVVMEMSKNLNFKPCMFLRRDNVGRRICYDNLLTIIGKGYNTRYIRITMEGLREYKGKKILGLGEISVSEYGEVESANCKITAKGISKNDWGQLRRLVDGYSQRRQILPQGEWVRGLMQRRSLDRRLAVVERELEMARATWGKIQLRLSIWGGFFIVTGLIGWVVAQRWMRKRGLNKLRWRITRDLHDDVGSNLASIALTAEHLKQANVNMEIQQSISDLSLLAKEAFASLREVVWVVNENTIRLPLLIQKLGERAERVLGAERVVVKTLPDCPDHIVPLTLKRHLIMLFKEIIHNCARHAQARQIWVDFSISDRCLEISVRDDGCGFDTTAPTDGWGLESMKERALEIGGKLKVESKVGVGTQVILRIPLASLMNEAEDLYKTSN